MLRSHPFNLRGLAAAAFLIVALAILIAGDQAATEQAPVPRALAVEQSDAGDRWLRTLNAGIARCAAKGGCSLRDRPDEELQALEDDCSRSAEAAEACRTPTEEASDVE